jgi:hypothetical protein
MLTLSTLSTLIEKIRIDQSKMVQPTKSEDDVSECLVRLDSQRTYPEYHQQIFPHTHTQPSNLHARTGN